jgi:hypothetical protein
MSGKKGKTKASDTFYKQGFDDAQKDSPWFRWRRHAHLNSYRLGFKHGSKLRGIK